MPLRIQTFSNLTGGNSVYKALSHPLAAPKARDLLRRLAAAGPVALYDPFDLLGAFAEFYGLDGVSVAGVYVQDVEAVGREILGQTARPVTELPHAPVGAVLVAAFDGARPVANIRHLLPRDALVLTLDELRLPEALLTDRSRYLSTLNFATNFVFFRDAGGHHTRLVTANYWSGYGAPATRLWCHLMDAEGVGLAEWIEELPPGPATVVIDSAEIRRRFDLPEFTGQMFVHVIGAAGHDVVKYALDTYGDADTVLSCTHDANAWPSDRYAGLPAPAPGERVVLWVQNSHPRPIPPGEIGLNRMGCEDVVWLDRPIPPFGTRALDVAELLPGLRWPEQVEVRAGKHFVRPRYEVMAADGRRRIAHMNVERADLQPDPRLAELGPLLGKGFVLPAPVPPLDRFRTLALPTPMSTAQTALPLAVVVYDADGTEVVRRSLGNLPRDHATLVDVEALLAEAGRTLPGGYGHLELVYDFAAGTLADGWLHGLFRYHDKASGHAAETSFGAHVYNTVLVYRNEPQSYTGRPPGLSTRLFLRLGPAPLDTLCHLIYPASTPWHPHSDTMLILHDRHGTEVARRALRIPCGGSRFFRYHKVFDPEARARAGDHAYILVRDLTCRLFGYHGLIRDGAAFSLDHMFGF